jgi:Protein of unknown function DUF45
MLNEINWLQKLQSIATKDLWASMGKPEQRSHPEGFTKASCQLLMVTLIAGKIHEGAAKLSHGRVAKVLRAVDLPPEVLEARKNLHRVMQRKSLKRLRQAAFHYSDDFDAPHWDAGYNSVLSYEAVNDVPHYFFSPFSSVVALGHLVMAPAFVQNYVVVHEVAHLRHMNHGPKFWSLVDELTPHTKAAIRWLRAEGALLLRIG